MARRRRLDAELVEQGLFSSRDEAMRAVLAGDVCTSDRRMEFPGEQVRPGIELHVRGRIPYVGRGGLKLERALDAFGVDPRGMACLDVGCSTGGFTDCLLKRGAASVLAVDVGYAQFDWGLRTDPRVTLRERTNMVDLPDDENRHGIDLAVCDVSFTSVRTVLPAVVEMLREEDSAFLTLVKPQFEAERDEVGDGGIVSDPTVHLRALSDVAQAFCEEGLRPVAACPSPIRGHKGNREFLLLGRTATGHLTCGLDLEAVVSDGAAARVG